MITLPKSKKQLAMCQRLISEKKLPVGKRCAAICKAMALPVLVSRRCLVC